jgi:flagellar biosynthetic protein FlhB
MSEESLQDKDSKTEQPTQKRSQEALKRGQVIVSKELYSFFSILGLFLSLIFLLPIIAKKYALYLQGFISNAGDFILIDGYLSVLLRGLVMKAFWICIPFFLILLILSICANFIHHFRFVISLHTLKPRFSALSPINGLHRIFSFKNFIELLKNCLKILILGALLYFVVKSSVAYLCDYSHMHAQSIIKVLYHRILLVLGFVSLIMGAIAIGDYLFQRRAYFLGLKMTKQEIKDEYRQTEGNVEMKRYIKRQMIRSLRYNVAIAVQKADLLLTNPNHVAIALKYNEKSMNAPCITAKGLGELALQMKTIARESGVIIIENKKLARSLYQNVEVEQAILPQYYEAVAEIINYAYSVQKKRQER